MPAKKKPATKKPAPKGTLTPEERAAMKETLRERKASGTREDGERDLREKIAALKQPDRAMAERIHAVVTERAPHLVPKTWYGMPAWANGEGQTVAFFQAASKFKTRYATLGFSDKAALDDGPTWPVAFAVRELTDAAIAKIGTLIERAAK